MEKRIAFSIGMMAAILCLAADATFTVDAGHPTGKTSPSLYGLRTEEISHSYDGGLCAELIPNRDFLEDRNAPFHGSVVNAESSAATVMFDSNNSFNNKLATSLRLAIYDICRMAMVPF